MKTTGRTSEERIGRTSERGARRATESEEDERERFVETSEGKERIGLARAIGRTSESDCDCHGRTSGSEWTRLVVIGRTSESDLGWSNW